MGRSRSSFARAVAIALTGLLLAGCGGTTAPPTSASPSSVSDASASGYLLPAPAGTTLVVTNGNQDSLDHAPGQPGQWAWDFALTGNVPLPVVAARAGTVIGARGDSTVQCTDANTLIDGTADPNCWTEANYVLIDQGDGTSGLYMHLSSAAVSVGEQVCRGRPIGVDGETGWASGPHVHFQVETTPSTRSGSGWWFGASLPGVRFSDPDVLRQNADGVPVRGSYVSANVASCQTAASAPKPTPPEAPAEVVLHSEAPYECGFGEYCSWETVSWAAAADRTSHVEIFYVRSNDVPDSGEPVSCERDAARSARTRPR